MTDFTVSLRFRADGTGAVQVIDQISGKTANMGATAKRAGQEGSKGLKRVGDQASETDSKVQQLTRRVAALAVGYASLRSVAQLGRLADTYTDLNAQIRIVTRSAEEQAHVLARVEEIASRTGQEMVTVGQLTTRTIRALESSGESAEDAIEKGVLLAQVVSDAVLASGASAVEANAAMIQLSQGLASGELRGEEFRSVMEQTPRVAQALASALGMTIGQLRELAEQGELTTQVVTEALLGQMDALSEEAAAIPPTLARAWQALENRVTIYVGEADTALGMSRTLAEAMLLLSENLDTVVGSVEVLTVLIGARLLGALGGVIAATGRKTAAWAAATAQTIAYQIALARMSGVSQVVAVRMVAMGAAAQAANRAMALIGGPIGVATLALVGLGYAVSDSISEFDELGESVTRNSDEAAEALQRLKLIVTEGWETARIWEVNSTLDVLREEALQLEQDLERLENRRRSMARHGSGFIQTEPTEDERVGQQRLETLREQVRLAEQLAGIRSDDDLAWLIRAVGEAAAFATPWLDRLAAAYGTQAEASDKITDPLEEQVANLERQVAALDRSAVEMVEWERARALVTAAEQDAKDSTTANTEAVNRYYDRIAALTGQLSAHERATRRAEAEQRAYQSAADDTQSTLAELLEEYDPLAAEQERLNEAWDTAAGLLELSDEQLAEYGITSGEVRRVLELLARAQQDLNNVDTSKFEAALQSMAGQIAAIEEGEEALREWEKQQYINQQLLEAGIPLNREWTDLQRQQAETIMAVAGRLFELNNEMERNAMVSQLGGNIARSITSGAGLGDALARGFSATGSQALTEEIEKQIAGALDGVELDSPEFGAAAMAVGHAVGGQMGAAIGTALGAAIGSVIPGIGTALGAVIGGAIGGLFDGGSTPKFQVSGANVGKMDIGVDEIVQTHLAQINLAFRGIEDESQRELREALFQFDATIAGIITDAAQLEAVEAALADIRYSSRSDGEDIQKLLSQRLDAILGTFDGFIEGVVQRGFGLEAQFQRLLDIMDIERSILFRRDLGLTGTEGLTAPENPPGLVDPDDPPPGIVVPEMSGPGGGLIGQAVQAALDAAADAAAQAAQEVREFEEALDGTRDASEVSNPALQQTLYLIEELARPTETLGEAYERLLTVTGDLDTALALIGGKIGDSRVELIRFGDSLSEVFGDDTERISGLFDRIFETFFSAEERAQVAAEQARDRAMDLLADIGIEATEELLTREGFRDLFDRLLPELEPEQVALLLEAGDAVADFIDATGQGAESIASFMEDINDQIFELTASEARQQWRDLREEIEANIQRAEELGVSEAELARVRLLARLQMEEFAAALEASIESLAEQLFGMDHQAEQVSNAQAQISQERLQQLEAERRALQQIQDFLDSLQLSNLSTLTPEERLGEAQSQFDEALAAAGEGDTDALADLPELFQQLLQEAQSFYGVTSPEYQAILDQGQQALEGFGPPPDPPDPPTADQVGGIQQSAQNMELSQLEQIQLAQQLLDELGVLSSVTGDSLADLADRYDIPLEELIEIITGDLVPGTQETIEVLGALATSMGISISELADAIGMDIGSLEDTESTLSQALQDVIATLPEEFQEQLLGPLGDIADAASPEEVQAAMDALLAATNELPAEYRDLLAPFFDEIDISDMAAEQVDALLAIQDINTRQAAAAEASEALLDRIANNLHALNSHENIPAFATGGLVSSPTVGLIGETGPELILPPGVTAFFRQHGVPVSGGDNGELRAIRERLERMEALAEAAAAQRDAHIDATRDTGSRSVERLDLLVTEQRRANNTPRPQPALVRP